MQEVDSQHLSTWMECIGASVLHEDLDPHDRNRLAAELDLPPQFGGVGLQSLIRAADEKLLGSWASVSADVIAYFRTKNLLV